MAVSSALTKGRYHIYRYVHGLILALVFSNCLLASYVPIFIDFIVLTVLRPFVFALLRPPSISLNSRPCAREGTEGSTLRDRYQNGRGDVNPEHNGTILSFVAGSVSGCRSPFQPSPFLNLLDSLTALPP